MTKRTEWQHFPGLAGVIDRSAEGDRMRPHLVYLVRGSGNYCLAGLTAREAAPEVLKFVRSDADSGKRSKGARVLAKIADYSLLPDLKAAAEKEKSKAVRQALQATIKFIEQLEPENSPERIHAP